MSTTISPNRNNSQHSSHEAELPSEGQLLDSPPPASRRLFLLLMPKIIRFLISMILIGAGVGAYFWLMHADSQQVEIPPQLGPQVVQVAPIITSSAPVEILSHGKIVPLRNVDIASEIQGRIVYKSPSCRVGDVVRQGEVLFRIDPQDYELEVQRLQAELGQARANLNESKADTQSIQNQIKIAEQDLAIYQRELARYDKLADKGAFSQSDLDNAHRSELQAQNSLQKLKDQLRMIESRVTGQQHSIEKIDSQLNRAKLDVRRTEIVAPLTGLVTAVMVEADGFVQKGGGIVTLQDSSQIEVECSLPLKTMQYVWSSQHSELSKYELPKLPVYISLKSGGVKYTWSGELARYAASSIEESTRAVPIRVSVNAPVNTLPGQTHPDLLEGMFVEIQIQTSPQGTRLQIPAQALYPGDQIWLVDQNGELRSQHVELLSRKGVYALIRPVTELLGETNHVVVSPLVDARDGLKVQVEDVQP